MTTILKNLRIAIGVLLTLVSHNLYAHGGGLDSYGCHRNNSKGNYHCHQGRYKGREFASQQDMLRQLEADRRAASREPKSIEERLRELKGLYEEGLISEDDYEKKQQEILKDL